MDFEEGVAIFFIVALIVFMVLTMLAVFQIPDNAKFVCNTKNLDLIDYEKEWFRLTKVECAKLPEENYENYEVFE